jgi:hypothetical protein
MKLNLFFLAIFSIIQRVYPGSPVMGHKRYFWENLVKIYLAEVYEFFFILGGKFGGEFFYIGTLSTRGFEGC